MSKDEMIEMLKISNCDVNTIIFAINAWEMGAEDEREECLKLSDTLGWVNVDHIKARNKK
jgi:hypothetical protein